MQKMLLKYGLIHIVHMVDKNFMMLIMKGLRL